eukprot:Em0011g151a
MQRTHLCFTPRCILPNYARYEVPMQVCSCKHRPHYPSHGLFFAHTMERYEKLRVIGQGAFGDLKTQNILLNKKRTVVKIGDFGISKVLSSKITSAQTVVGTPCYISPEICQGQVYGKKSDIWSLGCILYELTTLRKAFEGPRNPSDRPDVEQVMAFPVAVNALVNLSTDVGRLPCGVSRRSLSGEGRRLGTRMGSLNCLRQRSFFEDDYTPQDKTFCRGHRQDSEDWTDRGRKADLMGVKQVATDKGIVMTQGSGSSGALGNGDCNDSPEPKLVQGMLSFETSGDWLWPTLCDGHYLLVIIKVTLPASFVPTTVCCGTDSSILISTEGQLVVTGSNRYNKLALNPVKENADMNGPSPSPVPLEAVSLETQAASITVDKITSFQEVQSPMLRSQRLVSAAVGLNHTALVTDSGDCITCGSNKHGQLGFQPLKGIEHYNPTLVQGIPEKVTKVACGDFFTVVTTSGQMGRLGRDTANDCHTPEAVPLNDVTLSSVPGLTCSHRVTMLLATQTAPL